MTEKQRKVYEQLRKLVYTRSNEHELSKELSQIFNREIIVKDSTDELWTGDWYFSVHVEDDEDICGYFDIYYLKMREHDDDDNKFFITEIACDFEPLNDFLSWE